MKKKILTALIIVFLITLLCPEIFATVYTTVQGEEAYIGTLNYTADPLKFTITNEVLTDSPYTNTTIRYLQDQTDTMYSVFAFAAIQPIDVSMTAFCIDVKHKDNAAYFLGADFDWYGGSQATGLKINDSNGEDAALLVPKFDMLPTLAGKKHMLFVSGIQAGSEPVGIFVRVNNGVDIAVPEDSVYANSAHYPEPATLVSALIGILGFALKRFLRK